MTQKQALKIYKEFNEKLSAYSLVLSTTYFDKETCAPRKSLKYRNKCLSIMSGITFEIFTDKTFIEAVNILHSSKLDKVLQKDVEFTFKSLEKLTKFTKEEQVNFNLTLLNSNTAWHEAKEKNKYQLFEKHLQNVFKHTIDRYKRINPKQDTYLTCLKDYEPNVTIEIYDKLFEDIKKGLVPLIEKINKLNINDNFLYKYYPIDKQKKFMDILLKHLNYDSSWGYIGESMHPFSQHFCINDVRITTAYDPNNITSSIFSTIHEIGHAYFQHNVNPKFEATNLSESISMGMHESQSRLLENCIARRKSFWIPLYPKLQKLFPENLKDITLDEFIDAINVSKCSLIRIDADELTYPLHILIRYEIEKEMFKKDGKIDNLNIFWNQMYKKYLNVDVKNDSEGILQDIHWSQGSIGYFPTYALGSAIAAQILDTMEKQIDVDYLLSKGQFKKLMDYISRYHKNGALYDYNELLFQYTGSKFNSKYYIKYLTNKFKKVYKIK